MTAEVKQSFDCLAGFHTMGGEHAMEHYDVCIGPNLTCMNDLLNRMGQFDHVEYKGGLVKCRCGIFHIVITQPPP